MLRSLTMSAAKALVCGVLAVIAGWLFFIHAAGLLDHLTSGSWEIDDDRSIIERRLTAKYGARAAWRVHRPAGSGVAFSLLQRDRAPTIQLIGDSSLSDTDDLRFEADRLHEYYGRFLNDVSAYVRRGGPERRELAQALARARIDYQSFEGDLPDFEQFAVATDPSHDAAGAWERLAQRAEQTGRCVGSVTPIDGTAGPVSSSVRLYPRLLEVEIKRPWLSRDLLAEARTVPDPAIRGYFGAGGALHLIPRYLWVAMPTGVEIADLGTADARSLNAWIVDGNCCRVKCADGSVLLNPASVFVSKGRAVGHLQGAPPILEAVVSERRR